MAAPFVPVPVPVCRSWTKRKSPIRAVLSINSELLPPGRAWGDTVGTPTADASRWRPREDLLDGTFTPVDFKGSNKLGCLAPTLLGYEILERRARSTVYKILVTGALGGSWVIFRRYDDFCRLKDKLKELFPNFDPAFPPKRWFRDSYDSEFLKERQVGLQSFLQGLSSHKHIMSSDPVKQFLCLVDQQSPFDSLEETRAICETLEENNHHLQRELLENQREVDILRKTLEEKENHINLLMKKTALMPLFSGQHSAYKETGMDVSANHADGVNQ